MMPPLRSAVLAGALSLSACEGTVSLSITDAPADEASRVVIRISAVEFNRADGRNERIALDPVQEVELSALQGGITRSLLSGQDLPAGQYTAVQLELEADSGELDSYLELEDGSQLSLVLAPGSSLRASADFEIEDEESLALTVDFDLRRSLTATENAAGDRLLKPALRLVRDADTGSIVGTVDRALLEAADCDNGDAHDIGNVIYVYRGSVTADDIDGISPDPLSTALVRDDPSTGEPSYTLAFLEADSYTVALSCQGRADDPQRDDAIRFAASATVSVSAGVSTVQDF